jgi:hypothetical protein
MIARLIDPPPRLLATLLLAFGIAASPVGAPRAEAAEVTGFMSGANPDPLWGVGFGGSLGITLFNLVGLEFEGAWQGGQTAASDMWIASGKAYVGPTIGRLVPYVGLSTGLYRQGLSGQSDTGNISTVFAGLKFKLPVGVVIRGEYQWVSLPEDAMIVMDNRYFVGVGLSF